jgi:hypothetical protein
LYSSINIISDQIKVDEMDGTQDTSAREEKFTKMKNNLVKPERMNLLWKPK